MKSQKQKTVAMRDGGRRGPSVKPKDCDHPDSALAVAATMGNMGRRYCGQCGATVVQSDLTHEWVVDSGIQAKAPDVPPKTLVCVGVQPIVILGERYLPGDPVTVKPKPEQKEEFDRTIAFLRQTGSIIRREEWV